MKIASLLIALAALITMIVVSIGLTDALGSVIAPFVLLAGMIMGWMAKDLFRRGL